jgi:hypothetical protein
MVAKCSGFKKTGWENSALSLTLFILIPVMSVFANVGGNEIAAPARECCVTFCGGCGH